VGIKKYQSSNLAQKLIESTNVQPSTKAPLLPNPCCRLFLFSIQHFTNYFKNILIIYLKKFAVSSKSIIFVSTKRNNNAKDNNNN
jgi:hypothetical protein